jgi:trk/ktr system potassium uptake protein
VKVLIVGCGRVGSRIAHELDSGGHSVTIIDRDPGAFKRFAMRGVFSNDFQGSFIVGDGTESDLLRRAGIEDADCFVAMTDGDNRNIMAAQIAQHVFHVPNVVCRIYDPIRDQVYRKLGLNVYCPTVEGATAVQRMILGDAK